MKVFISWSGAKSGEVAAALGRCIREILPRVKPWMSSDVGVGASWQTEILHQLRDSKIGIICITKTNKNAPWLLFEAGALSKTAQNLYLYLVDLDFSELTGGPLADFKMLAADELGTSKLIQTINNHLKKSPLPEDEIKKRFETWWPALRKTLRGSSGENWEGFELDKFAIVFADIAGSSQLMFGAQSGIQQFFARVKKLQDVHKGRSIKYLGDSVLVVFQEAEAAFAFASELQGSFSRDPIHAGSAVLKARVGVHVGAARVIRTSYGQDLIGEAINVVARLTSIAEPGQVVVSAAATAALPLRQRRLLPAERIPNKHGELREFSRFVPTGPVANEK
jgi:class 3 adenylate cyclase